MSSVNDTRPTLDDVSLALDGLNNAIIEHTKWVAAWSRSAVCGTQFSSEYLSTDSVEQSTFDQWFFSPHHDFLRENNEFTTLERRHNAMHKCVQDIATKLNAGKTLNASEFNKFLRNEGLFATSLAKIRDDLLRLSHSYDFLTGAMNRQAFFQLLSQEHARVKRTSEFCCLVMVDLDRFKEINDQYGHLAGDTVLRYIADYLTNNLRPYDLICRFGGEEYLIGLPNASLGVAHKAIDRIREKIAGMQISVAKDTEITVTASFGISILSGDEDWSLAIEHADAAMYQAKSQGRNQVVVWKETTNK